MRWILYPFIQLWKIYYAFLFAIAFLFFYPAFYFLLKSEKGYPTVFVLKRYVALFSVYVSGIIISTKKEGILKVDQPYVLCCNHTSYLDIVLTYCIFKNYFVFMGKKEILIFLYLEIFLKTWI